MIEYTPTQIVRSHFDETTDWRAQGISWTQISEELHLTDKITNVSTPRAIYQHERQSRTTPQYRAALRWIAAHQQEIAELRARGFSRLDAINMTPSQESTDDSTSPPESVAVKPPSGYSADRTSPGQAARHGRLARGRSRLGGCPPPAGGVGGAGLCRGLATSCW